MFQRYICFQNAYVIQQQNVHKIFIISVSVFLFQGPPGPPGAIGPSGPAGKDVSNYKLNRNIATFKNYLKCIHYRGIIEMQTLLKKVYQQTFWLILEAGRIPTAFKTGCLSFKYLS